MLAQPECRDDRDFVPQAEPESVDVLVQQLRNRAPHIDSNVEDEIIENLRLLISTRSLQGWSDEDVLAELVAIGLVEDYAADLIGFTRGSGRPLAIPQTPLLFPRGLGGAPYWLRPGVRSVPSFTFRTRHRLHLAKKLAGVEGEDDPDSLRQLQEIPVVPLSPLRGSRIRTLLVIACVTLLLTNLIVWLV